MHPWEKDCSSLRLSGVNSQALFEETVSRQYRDTVFNEELPYFRVHSSASGCLLLQESAVPLMT